VVAEQQFEPRDLTESESWIHQSSLRSMFSMLDLNDEFQVMVSALPKQRDGSDVTEAERCRWSEETLPSANLNPHVDSIRRR
jgi:hypothetical protein